MIYHFSPYIRGDIGRVDPSRRTKAKTFAVFGRGDLEMHHYSYVRSNIRQKLYNAPSRRNYTHLIEKIAAYYDNYEYPNQAYMAGKGGRWMGVERCDNLFEIHI